MTRSTATAPVPEDVADRLRSADGLVVGLDFDGTLAPIKPTATEPTIAPANRAALEGLVEHDRARPAVVSGRALADLRPRVAVEGVLYAGNHGLEIDADPPLAASAAPIVEDRPDVDAYRSSIADACEAVRERVGDVPGCAVEDKGLTATVHYRRTPSDRVEAVAGTVESIVRARRDLRRRPAKQAVEIRPAVEWDKGAVVGRLAEGAPAGWRTIYVGDDVTDEDAFRALESPDVGVRIGGQDRTAADCRLPDQCSTAPFLRWLLTVPLGD